MQLEKNNNAIVGWKFDKYMGGGTWKDKKKTNKTNQ